MKGVLVMLDGETRCERRILECQCLGKESVGGLQRSLENNNILILEN
jgi:hypothetical protein